MTKTISVKELRTQFPKIRRGISRGDQYLVIYRSKPLAEIIPVRRPSIKKSLAFFANPPKEVLFKSKISAVELVRRERDE